jgi:hypothetical protein
VLLILILEINSINFQPMYIATELWTTCIHLSRYISSLTQMTKFTFRAFTTLLRSSRFLLQLR